MATDVVIKTSKNVVMNVPSMKNMLRIGVIGFGYWGPNIVRNFHGQEHSCVSAVCDKSPKSLKRIQQAYPGMHVTDDAQELLRAADIDAIAIVTPVWTHYELAKT